LVYEVNILIFHVGKKPRSIFFSPIYFHPRVFSYKGISYFCVGALP
jgi:hypothetical protein